MARHFSFQAAELGESGLKMTCSSVVAISSGSCSRSTHQASCCSLAALWDHLCQSVWRSGSEHAHVPDEPGRIASPGSHPETCRKNGAADAEERAESGQSVAES